MNYIDILIWFSAILTISGFLFTSLTYILFPDLRTSSQKLAFWLTGASSGYVITTFIITRSDKSLLCIIESFCIQYFSIVVIFITVVVAMNMRKIFIVYKTKPLDCRVEITIYHRIFVWGLPLLLALLPLFLRAYGKNDTDHYCWIKTDHADKQKNNIGIMCEVICFFIPFLVSVGHNIIIYVSIARDAKELKV
jgi:hypothetical protein